MKCPDARNMISPYIDEELPPDEERKFIAHIGSCPACSEELTETQRLHGLFVSAERFEAPAGFATRVMAHVDEKAGSWFARLRQTIGGQPFFLRTIEVAFALVIVLIGILSGNMLTADGRVDTQPTVRESFSLDLFRATPPDSVGGAYMRVAGVDNER